MDVLTVFCLFHSVTTKMTTSSLAGSYKDHFLFYIDLISAMTQHVGLFIHTKTVSFPYEFLRKKKDSICKFIQKHLQDDGSSCFSQSLCHLYLTHHTFPS